MIVIIEGGAVSGRNTSDILELLRSLADPAIIESMVRSGIPNDTALGVSPAQLIRVSKEIGKDHELAGQLWDTGVHEARILATMIDEPAVVTGGQMDRWAADFKSWDLCDQCCFALFDRTPYAYDRCIRWSEDEREFVKRAAFVLMASLAIHDKAAPDERFAEFFPPIVRESSDDRNLVKKGVSWALRQIGKRNLSLNEKAVEVATGLLSAESKSAKWIARDALRDLQSEKIRKRLEKHR